MKNAILSYYKSRFLKSSPSCSVKLTTPQYLLYMLLSGPSPTHPIGHTFKVLSRIYLFCLYVPTAAWDQHNQAPLSHSLQAFSWDSYSHKLLELGVFISYYFPWSPLNSEYFLAHSRSLKYLSREKGEGLLKVDVYVSLKIFSILQFCYEPFSVNVVTEQAGHWVSYFPCLLFPHWRSRRRRQERECRKNYSETFSFPVSMPLMGD